MPLLEAENLTKSFGGVVAVQALSFSVAEGEILGLIGPNGAGKTTVFNLMTGFQRPDKGVIRFRGMDISQLRPHRVSQLGIMRTFQITKPFGHLTALENVMVAALAHGMDMAAARRAAAQTLGFVGMEAKALDPARELPVEGQKMLELARALVVRPKVLLLDEVMGGLTASEINRAMERLREVRQTGVAMIIVEHVMRAIMAISDRVVVMNFGQKLAEGRPSAVAADPQVRTAYLGRTDRA